MNVAILKQQLNDMLTKLSNVDDDIPVQFIDRISIKVCNEGGMDVHHPKEEDKVVSFVDIEVDLALD